MRVYHPKTSILQHHHDSLTDFQKGHIFETRRLKDSYTEISKELHIPRATMQHFLERFQHRGSEEIYLTLEDLKIHQRYSIAR